jgi:hypothetical protein
MREWSQDGDVENSARKTLPERPQRSHWKFNTKYPKYPKNIADHADLDCQVGQKTVCRKIYIYHISYMPI